MNMHGIIEPTRTELVGQRSLVDRAWEWLRRKRMFLLIVFAPTLLVAGYLYLIASDQYESEVHFLVHSTQPAPSAAGGLSSLLTSAAGMGGQNEAMSVADYLTSHDVVATLRREDQLVERFHRSDADIFSRLSDPNPTPETLLKYYNKQVEVQFSSETGITTLIVRSFRPADSYQLARKLLQLGEQRVNILNERSYRDSIAMAQRQLVEAEAALTANQEKMTRFREARSDIDPQAVGQSQIALVGQLTAQLAAARAQLNLMGRMIDHASPQYHAVATREQALEAQVAAQKSRLTGSDNAIAKDIGGFEQLKMRQDFLGRQYDAAATALQAAREQAQRQQLYVVRVVDANMPVKPLYPHRARILGTTFLALLLIYAISWLLVAGVREHTA